MFGSVEDKPKDARESTDLIPDSLSLAVVVVDEEDDREDWLPLDARWAVGWLAWDS